MWFHGRSRKRMMIMVLAGALAGATLAGCRHSPEDRAEHVVRKIGRELDLNDDQKAKLEALRSEFMAMHNESKAENDQFMAEVKAAIKSEKLTVEKLTELKKKHTEIRDRKAERLMPKIVAFHGSLTPQQKDKIVGRIEEFQDKMK